MTQKVTILVSLRAALLFGCASLVLLVCFPSFSTLLGLLLAIVNIALALPPGAWRKQLGVPLALVALLGLLAPRPAKALFGEDVAVLVQQLVQLRLMYQTAVQNLELAKQNILALTHKQTYQNLLQSVPGVNGWNSATYGNSQLPLSTAAQTLTGRGQVADLGRVSLIDSTSQNTVATVQQLQAWQQANRGAVNQWQGAVYSNDPAYNTEAAQRDLTNIGLVQIYGQAQANLAVNQQIAQQLTLQNIKDRNQAVSALNLWQSMQSAATEPYALGGMAEDLKTHSLF